MVGYIAFQDGRINYDEFAAMMRKGAGKLEGRLNEYCEMMQIDGVVGNMEILY